MYLGTGRLKECNDTMKSATWNLGILEFGAPESWNGTNLFYLFIPCVIPFWKQRCQSNTITLWNQPLGIL